jgi:hypothetical protein
MYQLVDASRCHLTDIEKFFLHEALCHLFAGRYYLARDSIDDAIEPPRLSTTRLREVSHTVDCITAEALLRAICYVEEFPARDYPAFR